MLISLSISNIAIIDQLEIDFEGGLNVMTGETGAGKTIIVQTIGLVLGARAQPDIIRTGASEAAVTASFSLHGLPQAPTIRAILGDAGIDAADDELIVRRVISSGGRSKATINGVPVTLAMLKDVAMHLVDVSSQHEHQLLLDPAQHVTLIDDFGVSTPVRQNYGEAYARYTQIMDDLRRMRDAEATAKEKFEFLKFQLNELETAAPQPGEIDELEEEHRRLKHAAALQTAASEASQQLYELPGSAVEVLDAVAARLADAARYDDRLGAWGETLERVRTEVEEVSRDVKDYADRLSDDPQRIEEIEDRIHLLRGLVRKHGGSLDDVIAKMSSIVDEIACVENHDKIVAALEKDQGVAREQLVAAADELSRARREAAKKLSMAVQKELAGLAMGKVRFAPTIERLHVVEEWTATGPDRVEFFIAPNVGEDLRPLVRTASGGELSRIMLAIKRVLSDQANLASTYIFDEVDSGIGGATAEVVGKKLMEVAAARQVICITHLPQVACFGAAHYRIGKRVTKGRTVAEVGKLGDDDRVEEIARMLGGVKVTNVTRTHAQELLNEAAGRGG